MNTYNTLDIDTDNKEFLEHVTLKVSQCKNIQKMNVELSETKGFHIRLWCNMDCDLCRFVFDDVIRYAYDQFREPFSRNVLFNKKEFFNVKK